MTRLTIDLRLYASSITYRAMGLLISAAALRPHVTDCMVVPSTALQCTHIFTCAGSAQQPKQKKSKEELEAAWEARKVSALTKRGLLGFLNPEAPEYVPKPAKHKKQETSSVTPSAELVAPVPHMQASQREQKGSSQVSTAGHTVPAHHSSTPEDELSSGTEQALLAQCMNLLQGPEHAASDVHTPQQELSRQEDNILQPVFEQVPPGEYLGPEQLTKTSQHGENVCTHSRDLEQLEQLEQGATHELLAEPSVPDKHGMIPQQEQDFRAGDSSSEQRLLGQKLQLPRSEQSGRAGGQPTGQLLLADCMNVLQNSEAQTSRMQHDQRMLSEQELHELHQLQQEQLQQIEGGSALGPPGRQQTHVPEQHYVTTQHSVTPEQNGSTMQAAKEQLLMARHIDMPQAPESSSESLGRFPHTLHYQ